MHGHVHRQTAVAAHGDRIGPRLGAGDAGGDDPVVAAAGTGLADTSHPDRAGVVVGRQGVGVGDGVTQRIGNAGEQAAFPIAGGVRKGGHPVQAIGILVHLPEVEIVVVLVGDRVNGVAGVIEGTSDLGDAPGRAHGGAQVLPGDLQGAAAGVRHFSQQLLATPVREVGGEAVGEDGLVPVPVLDVLDHPFVAGGAIRVRAAGHEVLDRAVHPLLVVREDLGRTVGQELVVVTGELIVEVRGRGVEAVRVPMVDVLAAEEVGARHLVVAGFVDPDVVGVRPADAKRSHAVVVTVVGALPGQAGAAGGGNLDIREALEQVASVQVHVPQTAVPRKHSVEGGVPVLPTSAELRHLRGGELLHVPLVALRGFLLANLLLQLRIRRGGAAVLERSAETLLVECRRGRGLPQDQAKASQHRRNRALHAIVPDLPHRRSLQPVSGLSADGADLRITCWRAWLRRGFVGVEEHGG